jgi:galactokinase
MDQYTISIGGLMMIDTSKKTYEKLEGSMGRLLVIDSGESKNTQGVLSKAKVNAKEAIKHVKRSNKDFDLRKSKKTDYKKYLNEIPINLRGYWESTILNHEITKSAIKILARVNSSTSELGELMNSHQYLLKNNIKNTPIKLSNQMDEAINAGAIGAKIVGSGGGGCMVVMVNEKNISKVKKAILSSGAKDVFEVNITN